MLQKFMFKARRPFFSSLGSQIKQLKEMTGAPLMKCKEALNQHSNIEEAIQYLKQKNLVFAEKKAQNVSKEGLYSIRENNRAVHVLQVNSETDFVSRNDDFLQFSRIATEALGNISETVFQDGFNQLSEELLSDISLADSNLLEAQKLLTAKIQENIKLTDLYNRNLGENEFASWYVHKSFANNMGPSICLLVLRCASNKQELLKQVANNLAVHTFCNSPTYITKNDIPTDLYEEKKQGFISELDDRVKSKGDEIVNKVIKGKMAKYFDDDVLMTQEVDFYGEGATVADYLKEMEKKTNTPIEIVEYKIFKI